MIERPILFNGEMVRAILDGTKTQTRRPVKYIPAVGEPDDWCHRTDDPELARIVGDYRRWCPFGIPGDRLWVRETWAKVPAYRRGNERWSVWQGLPHRFHPTEDYAAYFRQGFDRSGHGRWRPSIHMPRWASRITLWVAAVRVARVADITTDEARAEGFPSVAAFMAMWHKIYGPDVEWCWVVEFMRV